MIRFFVARWERAVGLQDHPEPQPDLVERLLFALDRVGRPNTPVGVVTGGGKPFLGRGRGGLLLASPELGALLTDDELAAMVRYVLVVPPGAGGDQARFRAYLDEGGAPLPYIGARAKLAEPLHLSEWQRLGPVRYVLVSVVMFGLMLVIGLLAATGRGAVLSCDLSVESCEEL